MIWVWIKNVKKNKHEALIKVNNFFVRLSSVFKIRMFASLYITSVTNCWITGVDSSPTFPIVFYLMWLKLLILQHSPTCLDIFSQQCINYWKNVSYAWDQARFIERFNFYDFKNKFECILHFVSALANIFISLKKDWYRWIRKCILPVPQSCNRFNISILITKKKKEKKRKTERICNTEN